MKSFLINKIRGLSRKKLVAGITILLLSFIVIKIFYLNRTQKPLPDARIVETAQVKKDNLQQTIRLLGTIRAHQSTTLITKAKGVLDILIPSGSSVKQGELIAKIRSLDTDTNSKLAKDAVTIAKMQYDRAVQLFNKGVVSKNGVEEKKALWIEAQRKQADANLQVDQINIVAPFEGTLGFFKIKAGSQVQEGEALVSLYDQRSLMVEFDIPLDIVKNLKTPTSLKIGGKQYTLNFVQRMIDEETHMCPAYVNIECSDCIIGSTTDVQLTIAEKNAVIVLPYEAVFLREGKPFVYLMKSNKAILTPISLGIREKELVEITKGLTPGENVILRGQARLYPGAPVRAS